MSTGHTAPMTTPSKANNGRKPAIIIGAILAFFILLWVISLFDGAPAPTPAPTATTTDGGDLNSPQNQATIHQGIITGLRQSGCLPAGWTDGEPLPATPLAPGCPTGAIG